MNQKTKFFQNILIIVIVFCLVSSMSPYIEPIVRADPPENNFVIDGDTVYVNDALVYASATPHTVTGNTLVEYNFESKIYSGDVDFCWGFDVPKVKPISVEIWKNYTHYYTGVHDVEKYGSITLCNVSSYVNLGIENYINYNVTVGSVNNTYLFNISYDANGNGTDVSEVYAFSSYSVSGNDYTLSGNYTTEERYYYTKDFFDWKTWNPSFTKINYEHGGMNTWYLLSGIPIVVNVEYKIRARLQTPFSLNATSGKYWWAFKPSIETLSQAIANNHFYCLDPWWNSSWNHYKTINIDSGQVPSTLTNFPILVNITDTDLRDDANSDGGDIAFVLASDNTTQLKHEIEKYDSATGHLIAWVNVTSLPHDSDLQINMYYNNSGASDQTDAENVWDSNYLGVWHMKESSGTIYDSTSNDYDSTVIGGTPDYSQAGEIGNSIYIGANEGFELKDFAGIDVSGTQISVETWVKRGNTAGLMEMVAKYDNVGGAGEWLIRFNSNDVIVWYLRHTTTTNQYTTTTTFTDTTNFHYYVAVHETGDGSTTKIYFDGSNDTTASWTVGDGTLLPRASVYEVSLGNLKYQGRWDLQELFGTQDETRISNIIRSDDWITTSYNTVNNASVVGFIKSIGSEQNINSVPTFADEAPTNTSTDVSLTPKCYVVCNDADGGDTLIVDFYENSTGSFIWRDGWTGQSPGSNLSFNFTQASSYSTKYYWQVFSNDGTDNSSDTYHFTTEACGSQNTVYVDDDFTTSTVGWGCTKFDNIQNATNNVTTGGTVYIWAGIYPEQIIANKSLDYIGNSSSTVIINGTDGGTEKGFDIQADYVNISNVNISDHINGIYFSTNYGNSIIENCIFNSNADDGLELHTNNHQIDIKNCTFLNNDDNGIEGQQWHDYINITNCTFYGQDGSGDWGIWVEWMNHSNISNCHIYDNKDGIWFYDCDYNMMWNTNISSNGEINIKFDQDCNNNDMYHCNFSKSESYHSVNIEENCHNNTLENCTFFENYQSTDYAGLYFYYTGCVDNYVYNCTFTDNDVGVYIDYADGPITVKGCNFTGNEKGIFIDTSSGNIIYDNWFNNNINAKEDGSPTNLWNTTKASGTNIYGGSFLGGNYWHNYTGADTDGDGLGDTNIPWNDNGNISNGGDSHPLTDVSIEFIWINITNTTWAIGNIVMDTSIWTNETGVTFIADKDNCTINTDLKLQITNDGADWTGATSSNGAGADIYRLNASIDNWNTEYQIVTASATTISLDITANQNETFDMRFDAPTSTTTGNQQSMTVTATLVKH